MDARGNIYEDDPKKISPEDKARLEGYLLAREDAELDAKIAQRKAMVEKLMQREKEVLDRLADA